MKIKIFSRKKDIRQTYRFFSTLDSAAILRLPPPAAKLPPYDLKTRNCFLYEDFVRAKSKFFIYTNSEVFGVLFNSPTVILYEFKFPSDWVVVPWQIEYVMRSLLMFYGNRKSSALVQLSRVPRPPRVPDSIAKNIFCRGGNNDLSILLVATQPGNINWFRYLFNMLFNSAFSLYDHVKILKRAELLTSLNYVQQRGKEVYDWMDSMSDPYSQLVIPTMVSTNLKRLFSIYCGGVETFDKHVKSLLKEGLITRGRVSKIREGIPDIYYLSLKSRISVNSSIIHRILNDFDQDLDASESFRSRLTLADRAFYDKEHSRMMEIAFDIREHENRVRDRVKRSERAEIRAHRRVFLLSELIKLFEEDVDIATFRIRDAHRDKVPLRKMGPLRAIYRERNERLRKTRHRINRCKKAAITHARRIVEGKQEIIECMQNAIPEYFSRFKEEKILFPKTVTDSTPISMIPFESSPLRGYNLAPAKIKKPRKKRKLPSPYVPPLTPFVI